jgi:uncharacterized membrane protein AbrB (regulator of aidB expression)
MSKLLAVVTGREISADVGAADLQTIATKWPYLLLIGVIIIALMVVVNIYYKAKEKNRT